MSEHPSKTVSVLIPTWQRINRLERCLRSLATQIRLPDQVIVIWQADDTPSRDFAESLRPVLPFRLDVIHEPERGVVPAENRGLTSAIGSLIALIDDDAEAPRDWLSRHITQFEDPLVGAVGGSAVNHLADGSPFPIHSVEPIGRLPWQGLPIGNMYDQPEEWRTRPPIEVDHLVGYNLVLRRCAFSRFEPALRRYWQLFEMDACLQVKSRGYRVLFDFGNCVDHYPTNTTYSGGRDGDLTVKVYNAAYNQSFVLGKHSPWHLIPLRLLVQLFIGRVNSPGMIAFLMACQRGGRIGRELGILWRTCGSVLMGWRDGLSHRSGRCPL
jgi:GT2 family glycosyltransferase